MTAADERDWDVRRRYESGPLGSDATPITGPVTDWATDFDHTDEVWKRDFYSVLEGLRTDCPIAHSDRYGGVWLPTTHEHVSAIAYDTDRFSSRSVVVSNHRPPREVAPAGVAPPISSDPPFHQTARRVLLPAFSPQSIARLEDGTRTYCHQLIDDMGDRSEVDGAVEYAQHIPVRVIADMLGFPQEDADTFRGFVHSVLEGVSRPPEERAPAMFEFFDYLFRQIEDHRRTPRDDLTTYLIDAEMDGRPLDPVHIGGTVALLLLAGIDTTWSAIGSSLWHFAQHPADLDRVVGEPDLLAGAIEEMLRAYAPVTMARLVKEDMDFDGCPMQADDWILLSFPAANRDPEAFDRADEVLIDREVNRHAAFGLGVHRCLGSHLARMELRVALETWIERFGSFRLTDPDAVTWSGGQVRGPRTLPMTVTRR